MGFNSSSGQTTAAISGGLSIANTAAKTTGVITRASAGSTTMGTVPAGKAWYIVGASLSLAQGGAAANSHSDIKINGESILSAVVYYAVATFNSSQISNSWNVTGAPYLTAGQTITLVSDGDAATYATAQYVEVTV